MLTQTSVAGSTRTVTALLAAAAAAWAALIATAESSEMETSAPAFLLAWVVMMAAMMLPSAAPLVLLYRRASQAGATALLVSGYLLVWAAFGVGVYLAQRAVVAATNAWTSLGDRMHLGVAAVLAVAALYQLTPLKSACLRRCRTPLDFLMQRWRGGARGALRLGVEHGFYCVGCCWMLMAVLVAAGAMSLPWVAAIAAVVAAEKLLPVGERLARVTAVALLALAVAVALEPDLAMLVRGGANGM